VLATGIMSFAMHEIVYFGRGLPWFIMSFIPYFDQYKIQGVGGHETCGSKMLTIAGQNPYFIRAMGLRKAHSYNTLHC
jgi:hypothetical protein